MRNIKKYMSEDMFAAAENMSGYPYDCVTSKRPGFAFVKENGNVYYNKGPLPTFKQYWYFSGTSIQYYTYSDGTWILDGESDDTLIFPSKTEPISEFYRFRSDEVVGNPPYHFLIENQSITLNVGDCWLVEDTTETIYSNTYPVSLHKIYTTGETTTVTGSSYDDVYQIFYISGDTSNKQYFVLLERVYRDGTYKEEYNNFSQVYAFPDEIDEEYDLHQVGTFMKIENNWPEPNPYYPVCWSIHKQVVSESQEKGGDGQIATEILPVVFIEFEKADNGNYNLLSLNFTDCSQSGFTFTLDNYYAVLTDSLVKMLSDDVEHYSGSSMTYKIFSREDYPDEQFIGMIANLNSCSMRALYPAYVIFPAGSSPVRQNSNSTKTVIVDDNYAIFRLRIEDSDLFNPPTILTSSDWDGSGCNGGDVVEA